MANVGIPYLESGESLILTTDRVSVNAIQYDVLLTTRYLILVDARYAQFQPQMIPLLTIESVKGGKTANGELVITLFLSDTGSSGGSESRILVFSQQPGEQRKRERDDWLKTLMGLIVSARQETSFDSMPAADLHTGIRPSMKRSIAPEIPLPYTKVVETRPAQIELIILPDEPESPVFSEENQEFPEMAFAGEKTPSEITPLQSAMEETPGNSQELPGSLDMLSPPLPVLEETVDASPEPTESPDSLSPPLPVLEETVDASPEPTESPDSLSPLLPVLKEPVDASPEPTESPDSLSPPLPVLEEPVDASPEPTESPDSLSLPELSKNVEFAGLYGEESASPNTATLVQTCEERPVAPEADSEVLKTVPVSLLAAVRSLISPSGTPGITNTRLPSPSGIDETKLALAEVMVSPDTQWNPEDQKIVVSLPATEEKAEPRHLSEPSAPDEKSVASLVESESPGLPLSAEPVTPGSPPIHGQDFPTAEPLQPEPGKGDEAAVQQPVLETNPDRPGSPPPLGGVASNRNTLIAVAAVLLIILGIAGMMVFYPQNQAAPVIEPTLVSTPAIQLTPLTTPSTPQTTAVIIPPTGVWVRVNYTRAYNGWVGVPGSLREVSGSGDQIFKIPAGDSIVQAQIYKSDSSGDRLTIEIYRDGKIIGNRTASTPGSSVELLIDTKTGNPPGMTPVITPTGNQTGSGSGLIMYF